MSTTPASLHCEACGQTYAWKPQLAGKTARCRCGASLRIPLNPPAAPAASPGSPPLPALAYGSRPLNQREEALARARRNFDPEKFRNLHGPLAIIAVGMLILFLFTWSAAGTRSLTHAMLSVWGELLLAVPAMFLAVFIICRLRGLKLGPLHLVVLKLLAIIIGPAAITMLLQFPLAFIPLGFLANWLIGFCLYFALFGVFFGLDQEDTWYCVLTIVLVDIAAGLLLHFVG